MPELKIDSGIAGASLPDFERGVTWRETMNYAAAVEDENPRYLDDTRQGGVIAPPMFAVAFTWPVMEGFQAYLKKHLPAEILGRVVHAAEHLSFSRPVRPGDQLHATAGVISVEPVSAGSLAVLKIEVRDSGNRPVFTEEAGFLFRGVSLSGAKKVIQPPASWPETDKGDTILWEKSIRVARSAPWIYDGCTNIVFPIHTSVDFARSVGLPDIILQGSATLALAAREVVEHVAEGDPEAIKELACRFTGLVIPETSIRFQVLKTDATGAGRGVCFRILDAGGKPVLSHGYARISQNRDN